MRKLFASLLVLLALLAVMPTVLAVEDVQTTEFYERVDGEDLPAVSFFSNAEWDDSWTSYKDQLTGDALTIYQALETAFAADSIVPETMNINGVDTVCWNVSVSDTVSYSSGEDFNAKFDEWVAGKADAAILACQAFSYDHPEYFWVRQSYVYGYNGSGENGTATFTLIAGFVAQPSCDTVAERDAQQAKLTPVIEEILDAVTGMSPAKKLEYFDGWLVANNHYNHTAADTENYIQTDDTPWSIAGALLDECSPVCEGYAKTFQLLCHKVGVPCLEVSGIANGGGHMWTAVMMDDAWYFCDPTWDDPSYEDGTDGDVSTKLHFLTSQPATHTTGMSLMTPTISESVYVEPVAKVPAPTNPHWEKQTMKWDLPEDTSNIAYLEVQYYVPGSNSYSTNTVAVGEFMTLGQWHIENMGDTIYFRVRAISSNVDEYSDSDFAVCEQTYEKIEELPAPTNVAWDGTTMTWSWEPETSEQAEMLRRYYVAIYYSETEDGEKDLIGRYGTANNCLELEDWGDAAVDDGFYSFAVYARSKDINVIADSEYSECSAAIEHKVPEKLAAPTDAKWDGSVATWAESTDEALGLMECYEVELYDQNGNIVWGERCYDDSRRSVFSSEVFEEYGAGKYTFSVRAISNDFTVRSNSAYVDSDTFTYTVPSSSLAVPTNVGWDGMTMKWDVVTDGSVGAYEVRYYNPEDADDWYSDVLPVGEYVTIGSRMIDRLGETIYFKVRALTANASQAADSDWVVCKETYEEAEPLPAPEVVWDEDVMTWTWNATEEQEAALARFRLEIYYSATEDGTPTLIQKVVISRNKTDYSAWQQYATDSGWYFFRMCACSGDTGVAVDSTWSAMSGGYQYEAADPLAPPTNLRWNGSVIEWDGLTSKQSLVWRYYLCLYYCGEDGSETPIQVDDAGCGKYEDSHTFGTQVMEKFGNGVYKFSICAQSNDYSMASNSETVWSDTFTYVNPYTKLDAPTNLRWDGATMKWDVPEDTSNIAYYYVHVFAPGNENRGWSWDVEPGDEFPALSMETVENLGTTLTFSVYAVSGNANKASDSGLAYCATNYTYTEPEPLDAPANVKYDPDAGKVTWDAVTGAEEYEMEIYYSETEDGKQKLVQSNTVEGNQFRFTGTSGLGYYHVQVRALSDGIHYCDGTQWGAHYYVPFLEKRALSIPNELMWGKKYTNSGTWNDVWEDIPGVVTWKRGVDQARYRVIFYQVQADGSAKELFGSTTRFGSNREMEYLSMEWFLAEDIESGTYYFTVQALGDGINYSDGGIATSDTWTYVKPEGQLEALENARWNENSMVWDQPADDTYYYGYELERYFSETVNGEKQKFSRSISRGTSGGKLHDEDLMMFGDGYYWFRVRQLSKDITTVNHSEWSQFSTPYNVNAVVDKVNETLADALTGITEDVAAAVEIVKAIDTDRLFEAMAADQSKGTSIETGGTLDMIQQLEEATGVETEIDVTGVPEGLVEDFIGSQIAVTGAALNATEDTEKVTLKIGAATPGVVIPTQYNNTVQFSMHLEDENGEKITTDGEKLDIPVRITLPVPAYINPAFLVVLHYHADGTYEEILPYVYREGSRWFAAFVVTSFSDFALATVTIDAEVVSEGVQITATFAAELEGSAFCAVYDGAGKMLGVTALDGMEVGECEMFIACDGNEAVSAKLFVVDGDSAPMYEASVCTITK